MPTILKQIETPYIDAQTLINLLSHYQRPREYVLRLVKNGELIRLKNGFYLITERIQQGENRIIPYEQVANMLYGPSYVSLEWALSFYGLIPERVHTVTSITLGRDKLFDTPIGSFSYKKLSPDRYSTGIAIKNEVNFPGGFMMATPEKALADLVFTQCKNLDKNQLKIELLESRRIEQESLQNLDKSLLETIGKSYRAQPVNNLLDIVGML